MHTHLNQLVAREQTRDRLARAEQHRATSPVASIAEKPGAAPLPRWRSLRALVGSQASRAAS
jgi:hypothetical protein